MTESWLQQCRQQGRLQPLSLHFADFIARMAKVSPDSPVVMAAALLCERNQAGDVCVDLSGHADVVLFADARGAAIAPCPVAPPLAEWRAALEAADCVGSPGELQPLILDGDRLYLGRVWQEESQVTDGILRRLIFLEPEDTVAFRERLGELFAPGEGQDVDWQKVASALAATRPFAVISGGPGTGKTTTVIKVLALLLDQQPGMQIALAAPTGKAAARMVESIRSRKAELKLDSSLSERIPEQASTLHRLLGYRGQRGYRHDRDNPLLIDCLVVDEASMIDLAMMARLLDALPEHARLILIGDRDQLASVDAGNVLGDITGRGRELSYDGETGSWLTTICGLESGALPLSDATPPIASAMGLLRTSHRFRDDSGIGRLARLVNQGAGREALEMLTGSGSGFGLQHVAPKPPDRPAIALLEQAVEVFATVLDCRNVESALARMDTLRLLCAQHEGPLGDRELNRLIEVGLRKKRRIVGGREFAGKPVMVTVNDYELQLFNGDMGLLWPDSENKLRVWFPAPGGEPRSIPVRSLPEHAPAWAMTVHKSQGSEFEAVMLILPADSDSPLLTRELLYTAITRARERVSIQATEAAFLTACHRRVQRASGLAPALGWPSR